MAPSEAQPRIRPLALEDLRRQLDLRPAAIHVGAGLTVALSGQPLVWREFLRIGLEIARSHNLLNEAQLRRQNEALDSVDLIERATIGSFIESKIRPRQALFEEWLQRTVGELRVVQPDIASPLAAAAQKGILLSSNNYDRLLGEATGLPIVTWREFRRIEQLQSPPRLLHIDGVWTEPESVVLSVRHDSQAALHREAIQNYLGPLRFLLLVGIGPGFFITALAQALKSREGTLPGAVLCRAEDLGMFTELLEAHLPWFQPVPFEGGFEALPGLLTGLFGKAVPALPTGGIPTPSARLFVPDTGSEVLDLAFLGDREEIVTALASGHVRAWGPSGERRYENFAQLKRKQGSRAWAIAARRTGLGVAAGFEDGTIALVGLNPGSETAYSTMRGGIWALAFGSSGRWLAAAVDNGHVELFSAGFPNAPTDTGSGSFRPAASSATVHEQGALEVEFSPDERTLASAGHDRLIRLWSVPDLKPLNTLAGHEDWVGSLAFSPDGTALASAGGDRSVVLWDLATRERRWRAFGHEEWIQSLAFHPSGQLVATGSWDKSVRVWDVASGAQLARFDGHTSRVWTVAFSPDGKWLASGGDDRTVRLWAIDVEALRRTAVAKPVPLPEDFIQLSRTPQRFATFLSRLPLRHRESIPLLETLEPGCLSDALRAASVLGAPSPAEFAERVLALEKAQDANFQPPPLWLAWMQQVRHKELERLGLELTALAERAAPSGAMPTPPPTHAPGESTTAPEEHHADLAPNQVPESSPSAAPPKETRTLEFEGNAFIAPSSSSKAPRKKGGPATKHRRDSAK